MSGTDMWSMTFGCADGVGSGAGGGPGDGGDCGNGAGGGWSCGVGDRFACGHSDGHFCGLKLTVGMHAGCESGRGKARGSGNKDGTGGRMVLLSR